MLFWTVGACPERVEGAHVLGARHSCGAFLVEERYKQ